MVKFTYRGLVFFCVILIICRVSHRWARLQVGALPPTSTGFWVWFVSFCLTRLGPGGTSIELVQCGHVLWLRGIDGTKWG